MGHGKKKIALFGRRENDYFLIFHVFQSFLFSNYLSIIYVWTNRRVHSRPCVFQAQATWKMSVNKPMLIAHFMRCTAVDSLSWALEFFNECFLISIALVIGSDLLKHSLLKWIQSVESITHIPHTFLWFRVTFFSKSQIS